jgi:uncharacterized glyoxalase superfamily protein PhnB
MASLPLARYLLRARDLVDARYAEPPGPPVMDADTASQVRTLMSKGFAGTVFLTTEDCRAEFEQLRARGVEFAEEPSDRPYGMDAAFHDPSGNSIRLTQLRPIG